MGYTHYWKSESPISLDVWIAICADAKTLIAAFPPSIRGVNVDDKEISFNGSCDSFVFLRLGSWGFARPVLNLMTGWFVRFWPWRRSSIRS
jgi:hypothetical protein